MLIQDPPVEITENLTMLGVRAYPLYLVGGEAEGAIFEGGVGAMGPVLKEQIAGLGLADGFIKQAIVTHAHPDHVMAVAMLRRMFPSIQVAASKAAAGVLLIEKAVGFFAKIDQAITAGLIDKGAIGEQHRPDAPTELQIPVDRQVGEGDTIDVAPLSFKVLETPGHSDCSLSFHEADAGILIISDATGYYMTDPDYWWPNYFTGYAAYLDSMVRLAALDAEILCLSHNAVVRGADAVRDYFQGAISTTEAYHDRIIAEFRSGDSVRDIASRLGAEVFEKAAFLTVDFFQKNCANMVKQSLRHEGLEESK